MHTGYFVMINHGDAAEDIDEWDWNSISEDHRDYDEYCTTSVDNELLNHALYL